MALPPDPIAAHQPRQGLYFLYFFDRHLPKVSGPESCKVFSRCEPVQVLMGSDVVVENLELLKCSSKRPAAWDDELPEQWLERSESTLDPAVLPGSVFLSGLVLDACDFEKCVEQPAVEHRFVVSFELADKATSALLKFEWVNCRHFDQP